MQLTVNEKTKIQRRIENHKLFSPKLILVITIFIDATGFGIIVPLLPFIADSLQAGSIALGILIASFSLMQFIFSPLLGKVSDRVGRKPILILSVLTSIGGFGLFALANSFLLLLISRLVAGLATETAVAQAYMADITSKTDRTADIGKLGAAHGAGFIVGPAIGGLLSIYGFSAAGIGAVIFTSINLILVLFFLPESLTKERRESKSITKTNNSVSWNIRKGLPKGLLAFILVIFFIVFLSFAAMPVTMPLLGIAYFSIGSVEASYFFVYIGVIQIILSGFLIGKLVAKFGDLKLIIIGPLLMMLGILFMPIFQNIGVFVFSLALVAFGVSIMRTVVPSYMSKATLESEQGSILGVTESVASISTVPGPLIGGLLFEFGGLSSPFFVSALMLLFSVFLGFSVLRKSVRSK